MSLGAIQASLRGEPYPAGPAPDLESQEEQQPASDEHSALKEACLARECNRCAITGSYDVTKAKSISRVDRGGLGREAHTVCVYFVPFALGRFENEKPCTEVSHVRTICLLRFKFGRSTTNAMVCLTFM